MYLILLLFFLGILKNDFSENLSEKSKIPFKKIKKSTKKWKIMSEIINLCHFGSKIEKSPVIKSLCIDFDHLIFLRKNPNFLCRMTQILCEMTQILCENHEFCVISWKKWHKFVPLKARKWVISIRSRHNFPIFEVLFFWKNMSFHFLCQPYLFLCVTHEICVQKSVFWKN